MTEQHQKQFTGWWIPAEAVLAFEQGAVSATGLLLLATVDSLTNKRDRVGCFASNGYLAKKLKVNERTISRSLRTLMEAGLLIELECGKGRRELSTKWSYTTLERTKKTYSTNCRTHPTICRNPSDKLSDGSLYYPSGNRVKEETSDSSRGSANPRGRSVDLLGASAAITAEAQRDLDRAQRLYDILHSKHRITSRPSIKKWADSFRILRQHVPESKIDESLSWFAIHVGERFVPSIQSAVSFRKKFVSLCDAIAREQEEQVEESEALDLTETEEKLVDKVLAMEWPRGDEEELARVVVLSYRNCKEFRLALARTKVGIGQQSYKTHVRQKLKYLVPVITSHFESVLSSVKDWKQWSGSFRSYVWTCSNTSVGRVMEKHAREYTGNAKAWSKLVMAVQKESNED